MRGCVPLNAGHVSEEFDFDFGGIGIVATAAF